jgi:hypothetical protein
MAVVDDQAVKVRFVPAGRTDLPLQRPGASVPMIETNAIQQNFGAILPHRVDDNCGCKRRSGTTKGEFS